MADTDTWDAEDFEPELPGRQGSDDKWDGEDATDGVKVSAESGTWEDSDDQDTTSNKQEADTQAYQRPKKKPIAERLAEKEAQTKKEEEGKVKQEEKMKTMTVEERQAERERLRKQKEQESLSLARGLFEEDKAKPDSEKPDSEKPDSEKPKPVNTSVDHMTPFSEPEFDQFGEALKSKIQFFEDSQHYNAFVLQFISDLSLTLCAEEVKKLGININTMYHEKERLRKEAEKEKKKKKKSKVSIKVDRADDLDLIGDANSGAYYDDDEFL